MPSLNPNQIIMRSVVWVVNKLKQKKIEKFEKPYKLKKYVLLFNRKK